MSGITQLGKTALMIAAWNGKTEVISLLVKAGATLDPCWEKASILSKDYLEYKSSWHNKGYTFSSHLDLLYSSVIF